MQKIAFKILMAAQWVKLGQVDITLENIKHAAQNSDSGVETMWAPVELQDKIDQPEKRNKYKSSRGFDDQ